jgi:DNA-binding response OmpR family regulator
MTGDGAHILVVDDEPQILRGLHVVLRSAGFQVAQAATQREALDAVAVRPPTS